MRKGAIFYPGTFDPITYGHVDLIERASRIFDEVIIVVMKNIKKKPLFTLEERLDMLKNTVEKIPNVSLDTHDGLLIDYVKKTGINVVLRGLRVVSDFDYEFQMALANKELCPDIETLFLMTNPKYSFISSSLVKEIAAMGGNLDPWVPDYVKKKLLEKLRKGGKDE
ncbi:MAG TPA: pantetheine-phosphate adenylyltransferase [Thermotogaceae bacterium]|nr:pantetheine-phosphate adenylyltransferase [Thermotogota bacterium]HEW92163.1 pantetheine-phosphate adenylyltransferase [Thermotogaceae bacterium]